MKTFKLILIILLFNSCKKDNNHDFIKNQLLISVTKFEDKYPILKDIKELPYNSYEIGVFKLENDTLIYIQRNEVIYNTNYSNFFFRDFKNKLKINDEFKIKTELKYLGSYITIKNNFVNFYDNANIMSNLLKGNNILKKIDLNKFSIKNYGENTIVDFNEPKFELYLLENNKITQLPDNYVLTK